MKVSHTELANQSEGQSLIVDNSALMPAESRAVPSQINMSSMASFKKSTSEFTLY